MDNKLESPTVGLGCRVLQGVRRVWMRPWPARQNLVSADDGGYKMLQDDIV